MRVFGSFDAAEFSAAREALSAALTALQAQAAAINARVADLPDATDSGEEEALVFVYEQSFSLSGGLSAAATSAAALDLAFTRFRASSERRKTKTIRSRKR